MYYGQNSKVLDDTQKTREVYLPSGTRWYDFWTHKKYTGGQSIQAEAPIEKMPLFIQAGAIIPTAPEIQFADEVKNKVIKIVVYVGADGEFMLYDDEGDNYTYEKDNYAFTKLVWKDQEQILEIQNAEGSFWMERKFEIVLIGAGDCNQRKSIDYDGTYLVVQF